MTEQRQTSPVQEESLDEVIVPARLHHVNLKAYSLRRCAISIQR